MWLIFPEKPSFGCGVEWGVSLERSSAFLVASGPCKKSIFVRHRAVLQTFADHEAAFEWITAR